MSRKVGADGKPYDPSERARRAFTELREFVEDTLASNRALDLTDGAHLTRTLNAVADRLATCDALEGLRGSQKQGQGGI